MKFRVTFKDPDTLDDTIKEVVDDGIASKFAAKQYDDEEAGAVRDVQIERLRKLCSRWFEYGEYVVIEIDTDAKTASVVERSGR